MPTAPYPASCGPRRFSSRDGDAPHHHRRVAALPVVGPSRSPSPPTVLPFSARAPLLRYRARIHRCTTRAAPCRAAADPGRVSCTRWRWVVDGRTRGAKGRREQRDPRLARERSRGARRRRRGSPLAVTPPAARKRRRRPSCPRPASRMEQGRRRRSRAPTALAPGGRGIGKGGGASCRCRRCHRCGRGGRHGCEWRAQDVEEEAEVGLPEEALDSSAPIPRRRPVLH
jgi:hypothetical protein